MSQLIDKVIEQIKEDVSIGDVTSLEVILQNVPKKVLEASLPETVSVPELKHDVDYGTKVASSPNDFVRTFEDTRLEGLAALEELHQFLSKNEIYADSLQWDTKTIKARLESVIETLRKKI